MKKLAIIFLMVILIVPCFMVLNAKAMESNPITNFDIFNVKLGMTEAEAEQKLEALGFKDKTTSYDRTKLLERHFVLADPSGKEKDIRLSLTPVKNVPSDKYKEFTYVWQIEYWYGLQSDVNPSLVEVESFKDNVFRKYGQPDLYIDYVKQGTETEEEYQNYIKANGNGFKIVYSKNNEASDKPKLEINIGTSTAYHMVLSWGDLLAQKKREMGFTVPTTTERNF